MQVSRLEPVASQEIKKPLIDKRVAPYLFIAPSICIIFAFAVYPIIAGFIGSFFTWSITSPERVWVGLHNYERVFGDRFYWQYLGQTFYYAIGSVTLGLLVSMIVALIVNAMPERLGKITTSVAFIPVVTSAVAVSLIWRWIYQPQFGLLNQVLKQLGFSPQGWIMSKELAMPSLIIMVIWKGLGYNLVLLLAGMQNISPHFYEAAQLDGANRFQIFTNITIPLLMPTITFLIVMGTIGSLQVFTEPYLLTEGGPGGVTRVTAMYIYTTAFNYGRMGLGSAMAFVLFIFILILTLIQMRYFRAREVTF